MKTIAVTGATGFIGSALTRHFSERGFRVIGLARKVTETLPSPMEWRAFDLSHEHSSHLLDGVDVLIHAAIQVRSDQDDAIQTNIQGTRQLLDIADACGVRRRIFFSSFAAHDDALSGYGKQKRALEKLFSGPFDSIIRPGLVVGNGGLFSRLTEDLRSRKIIPLIDGGLQQLQTIHIDDLCIAVERIITHDAMGTFNIAEPHPVTYKSFYTELCARIGVTPLFVPVPFTIARLALTIAKALHFPLPIDLDNLLGLKTMRPRETRADIERLGISVRNLRESLKTSLALPEVKTG